MTSQLLQALVLLALSCSTCLADMSKSTSWSAGSFFAAASQCEQSDLIARDQTSLLLQRLDSHLSSRNKKWLRDGIAMGAKRAAVYLAQQREWRPFLIDAAGCERVQAVLDDYRATLIGDAPETRKF